MNLSKDKEKKLEKAIGQAVRGYLGDEIEYALIDIMSKRDIYPDKDLEESKQANIVAVETLLEALEYRLEKFKG